MQHPVMEKLTVLLCYVPRVFMQHLIMETNSIVLCSQRVYVLPRHQNRGEEECEHCAFTCSHIVFTLPWDLSKNLQLCEDCKAWRAEL